MKKILVIDDDAAIRMLYSDELTEEGYDVVDCVDPSCLMGLIEQSNPDLVLMDIRLGRYDGLDLLQQIRNTYRGLSVILCTAYPAFEYDMKSVAADEFVVKSGDLRELKSKIRKVLEEGRPVLSTGRNSTYHGKIPGTFAQGHFGGKSR